MGKFKWSILIVIIQVALSLYLGMQLADDVQIPSHWNIKGEVNDYVGKWTGIFLFSVINIFTLSLMIFLPKFSVRYQKSKQKFDKIMPSLSFILIFFFACIHLYSILLAREILNSENNFILAILGLMFVLLGRILPKIPSNFFLGIRTPWTLSSDYVWEKTHKIGAVCYMLGGILMIAIPQLWRNSATAIIMTFVLFIILALYPVFYSLILFKKEI